MAPEQVKGSTLAVDCRTDVYSLGAVLYELLAGRPPFRAGSPLDTMLQVKHEEPVPPSRFQPKLPRDLETICLKCLEKVPGQRYQSAQSLAEDLDRYLNGQPIQARRITWLHRCWRWSRRNPGWAAAIVLALATLLGLAIGGPLVARRERQLRQQASENERQANAERARSRDQFESASLILENTLDQVLRSARLQDSALDEVRASITRNAVPYYEHFLLADATDRSVRVRQARAYLQLAAVHAKEQERDKAREEFQRSLEILESLNREAGTVDHLTQSSLASAHMEYGRFLQVHDNDMENSERHYRNALRHRTALLQETPRDPNCRDHMSIVLSLLGTLLKETPSREDEAEALLIQAAQLRDELVAELPDRMDLRHYAAMSHFNLGMLYRQQDKHADEIRHFQKAWDLERKLSDAKNVSSDTPYYISLLEGELGIAYGRAGRHDDAIRQLKPALRAAEALLLLFPSDKKYSQLTESYREVLAFVEKQ
jgi:tetratricopeptide (TPR) repeat protein